MRSRIARSIAATIVVAGCWLWPCGASSAEPAGPLDEAALKTMLTNLGFPPKEGKYPSGNLFYVVTYPHSGLDYQVTVTGGGKDYLWVLLDLWTLKPDQELPRDVALGMLDKNFDAKRVFFSYDRETRQLRLKAGLANHGIDPALLRSVMQEGVELCHTTSELWNPNKWPAPLQNPASPSTAAP